MFVRNKSTTPKPRNGIFELAATAKINVRFFLAALLGIGAYHLWSSRPEWWGLGILSLCLGAAAVSHTLAGLKELVHLMIQGRAISDQTKDAAETKVAREVTTDVLKNAGMK